MRMRLAPAVSSVALVLAVVTATVAAGTASASTASVAAHVQRAADNGVAAKSTTEILSDAIAATESADTVRISGTVQQGSSILTLDLVSDHGTGGGGSLTTNGATLDMILAPPSIYLRGSEKSWQKISGSAAAGKLFADRWLRTSSTNPDFESFTSLLDITAIAEQLASPKGTISKGKTTTYHGQPAVQVRSDNGAKRGILYVATTGKPYVLGLVGVGKKNPGELRFTQYDTAKLPPAPKESIDLDTLEQNGSSTTAP